jgi:hypothetical protein
MIQNRQRVQTHNHLDGQTERGREGDRERERERERHTHTNTHARTHAHTGHWAYTEIHSDLLYTIAGDFGSTSS